MALSFTQKKSIRRNFGKLQESLSIPNLIEVQKNSFSNFIKKTDNKKNSIYSKGLTRVFESIFPINDAADFSNFSFDAVYLEADNSILITQPLSFASTVPVNWGWVDSNPLINIFHCNFGLQHHCRSCHFYFQFVRAIH